MVTGAAECGCVSICSKLLFILICSVLVKVVKEALRISKPDVSSFLEPEGVPYQIKRISSFSALLNKVRQILMHQNLPERSSYFVFLR